MAKKKIILADNNKQSLNSYATVLRDEGYDVTEAGSFSAAKKALKEGHADLAVLDLHLKRDDDDADRSGIELAAVAHGQSMPAIILTGNPTPEAVRQANEQAAAPVIRKDEGPGPLLKALKKAEAKLKAIRKSFVPTVFLAHGHDKEARKAVVDFLKLGGLHV